MMIFSEDTEIAKLSPAMISSYSASLLEAEKFRRMACSMTSPVRALSCNLRPVPVCCEAPSHSEFTSQSYLVQFLVEEFMVGSHPVLVPLALDRV